MSFSEEMNDENDEKWIELNERVDRLIQLNLMHEEEREKAKQLIESFYEENQSLKFELSNLQIDNESRLMNQETDVNNLCDDFEQKLNSANELTTNLNTELNLKNNEMKFLKQTVEAKISEMNFLKQKVEAKDNKMNFLKQTVEAYESQIKTQKNQIVYLETEINENTEQQKESKVQFSRLKRFKKYLVSNQMEILTSVLAIKNLKEKSESLKEMNKQCQRLESFYRKCLDNIQRAKSQINDNLEETLILISNSDQIEINLNISNRSIQLKNTYTKSIYIGEWIIKVVNSFKTDIISYKIKGIKLEANQSIILWSNTAKNKNEFPPKEVIMWNQNNEDIIWLLNSRNEITIILYDADMKERSRRNISIANGKEVEC